MHNRPLQNCNHKCVSPESQSVRASQTFYLIIRLNEYLSIFVFRYIYGYRQGDLLS